MEALQGKTGSARDCLVYSASICLPRLGAVRRWRGCGNCAQGTWIPVWRCQGLKPPEAETD